MKLSMRQIAPAAIVVLLSTAPAFAGGGSWNHGGGHGWGKGDSSWGWNNGSGKGKGHTLVSNGTTGGGCGKPCTDISGTVPEIDAAAGMGSLAALGGLLIFVAERRRRKAA